MEKKAIIDPTVTPDLADELIKASGAVNNTTEEIEKLDDDFMKKAASVAAKKLQ